VLCLIGSADALLASKRFAQELNVECHTISLDDAAPPAYSKIDPAFHWPFPFEQIALSAAAADRQFKRLCSTIRPDIVAIDYLFTSLFIPSVFEMLTRRVVITHNREADLFEDLRQSGRLPAFVSASRLSSWRLRLFELWAYSQAASVVALVPQDLPRWRPAGRNALIRPILDHRKPRWRDTGTDTLFFVGNIAHQPNLLAVSWLCEMLAPHLATLLPSAQIRILGVEPDSIPADWIQPNVVFEGVGTKAQVLEGLTTCGLFVAPMGSGTGSKIKILECLAHGTPTLGTKHAYLGLDSDEGLPTLALHEPRKAAELIVQLLSDRSRLIEISARASLIADRMQQQSVLAWSKLIPCVMAHRPRKAWPRRFPLSSQQWVASPRSLWAGRKVDLLRQTSDDANIEGLYPPERLKGRLLRWTNGKASLTLPLRKDTLPVRLTLDAWNIREGESLRLTANSKELFFGTLDSKTWPRQFELPPLDGCDELNIQIESVPFSPPGDTRSLGVALRSLVLHRHPDSRLWSTIAKGPRSKFGSEHIRLKVQSGVRLVARHVLGEDYRAILTPRGRSRLFRPKRS